MFVRLKALNRKIVKCNWKVVRIIFLTEDNFMGEFCTVRIKIDFPITSPIINFTQIVV